MRWNAANYFSHRIHHIHRISYINLPQKSMRRIFVKNAVNFVVNFCAVKYIFSPHLPQSPHFLQKITQKPRPGHNPKTLYSTFPPLPGSAVYDPYLLIPNTPRPIIQTSSFRHSKTWLPPAFASLRFIVLPTSFNIARFNAIHQNCFDETNFQGVRVDLNPKSMTPKPAPHRPHQPPTIPPSTLPLFTLSCRFESPPI